LTGWRKLLFKKFKNTFPSGQNQIQNLKQDISFLQKQMEKVNLLSISLMDMRFMNIRKMRGFF